jgi:hypothetical protein
LLSGKLWLVAVVVALFLLPVTVAAQAGNSGRDRIGNINRGRVGVATAVKPAETLALNAKLKVRSGGFFLENTALLRAGRGNRVIPSSPPFAAVELGTNNASDYLVFKAGGAERATISTDGNVGIGTSNPLAKLHINKSTEGFRLTATDDNSPTWMQFNTSGGSGMGYFGVEGSTGGTFFPGLFPMPLPFLRVRAGRPLQLGTAGAVKMTLTSSGNVGIGTTSPVAKLQSQMTSATAEATGAAFAVGTATLPYAITAGHYDSNYAWIQSWSYPLQINSLGNNTILNSGGGYVGVGTATPGERLDVAGTFRASGQNGAPSSGAGVEVSYGGGVGYLQSYDRTGAGADAPLYISGSNIRLNGGGEGNVGIGTSGTLTEKLEVNGNIKLTGTINAKYQDVAEWVPSSEQLAAGTVVVLDSTKSNQVISSAVSYDTRVAGVISAQPASRSAKRATAKFWSPPPASQSKSRCEQRCDSHRRSARHQRHSRRRDEIRDRLSLPKKMHMPGTLIGKALEPLEKGSGEILVLLSLQ